MRGKKKVFSRIMHDHHHTVMLRGDCAFDAENPTLKSGSSIYYVSVSKINFFFLVITTTNYMLGLVAFTNVAKVIHIRRLKSDPRVNLLS